MTLEIEKLQVEDTVMAMIDGIAYQCTVEAIDIENGLVYLSCQGDEGREPNGLCFPIESLWLPGTDPPQ